jgi:hypothetical protein
MNSPVTLVEVRKVFGRQNAVIPGSNPAHSLYLRLPVLEKTKYMIMSRRLNSGQNQNIRK